MSNFVLEILEPIVHIIEVESSFLETVGDTIEIERYDTVNLELVNTEKVSVSDLPNDIPMSKIIGNLHYSRIDDLDNYILDFLDNNASVHVDNLLWGNNYVGLSGYLDQYGFDCGSP